MGENKILNKNLNNKWSNKNFAKNETGNKQKFQTIEEEGEKKIIIIEINKPIKVYVCSLLEIKKKIPQIEKFS
jgi:hypothetical protein